MRLTRTYLDQPLAVGSTVHLPEAASAHLVRVLRLGEGDACVLFNGDGADYDATLVAAGKRSAEVRVIGRRDLANESLLRLQLAQAVARGEKMDWILQKATELGVSSIMPVFTERTEVKLDGERSEKRQQHWRGVISAACEQSGRATLPPLGEPQSLASFASACDCTTRLMLDPGASDSLAALALPPDTSVALAIGPEGGLSSRDTAILHAAGFRSVRIGPRILRTETAGLAALAALQALYGDWR